MTAAHHSQQTGSTEQLAVLGRALHAPDHLSFHGATTQPLIQTHKHNREERDRRQVSKGNKKKHTTKE